MTIVRRVGAIQLRHAENCKYNITLALHLYIRAQQLLSEAEIEIHRVVYDLHPPVLDTMGGEHLGLIGRKERAEGLGATLTAISAPELPARCSGAWSS